MQDPVFDTCITHPDRNLGFWVLKAGRGGVYNYWKATHGRLIHLEYLFHEGALADPAAEASRTAYRRFLALMFALLCNVILLCVINYEDGNSQVSGKSAEECRRVDGLDGDKSRKMLINTWKPVPISVGACPFFISAID